MYAYEAYHDGTMQNYIPTDEEIQATLNKLPKVE